MTAPSWTAVAACVLLAVWLPVLAVLAAPVRAQRHRGTRVAGKAVAA